MMTIGIGGRDREGGEALRDENLPLQVLRVFGWIVLCIAVIAVAVAL